MTFTPVGVPNKRAIAVIASGALVSSRQNGDKQLTLAAAAASLPDLHSALLLLLRWISDCKLSRAV
jgi:hypothetical protein